MSCGWNGALARLFVEPGASPHTFDTSSETYDFISESVKASRTLLNSNTISGTRSQRSDRTRTGPDTVAGAIDFELTPQWLDLWLPRILGAAESSDVFAVAETLPEFGLKINRGNSTASTFNYLDCKVNRATIKGQSGGVCMASVEIVGKSQTTGGASPAVAIGATAAYTPYVFTDAALSLNDDLIGAAAISSFELTVDNLIESKFNNSLTATCLRETDRLVTFRCNLAASDTNMTDMYSDNAGAVVFNIVNGSRSALISLAQVQFGYEDPTVSGKSEVRWDIQGIARATSSVKEIIVTNDNS
jgi:hypothetical protein